MSKIKVYIVLAVLITLFALPSVAMATQPMLEIKTPGSHTLTDDYDVLYIETGNVTINGASHNVGAIEFRDIPASPPDAAVTVNSFKNVIISNLNVNPGGTNNGPQISFKAESTITGLAFNNVSITTKGSGNGVSTPDRKVYCNSMSFNGCTFNNAGAAAAPDTAYFGMLTYRNMYDESGKRGTPVITYSNCTANTGTAIANYSECNVVVTSCTFNNALVFVSGGEITASGNVLNSSSFQLNDAAVGSTISGNTFNDLNGAPFKSTIGYGESVIHLMSQYSRNGLSGTQAPNGNFITISGNDFNVSNKTLISADTYTNTNVSTTNITGSNTQVSFVTNDLLGCTGTEKVFDNTNSATQAAAGQILTIAGNSLPTSGLLASGISANNCDNVGNMDPIWNRGNDQSAFDSILLYPGQPFDLTALYSLKPNTSVSSISHTVSANAASLAGNYLLYSYDGSGTVTVKINVTSSAGTIPYSLTYKFRCINVPAYNPVYYPVYDPSYYYTPTQPTSPAPTGGSVSTANFPLVGKAVKAIKAYEKETLKGRVAMTVKKGYVFDILDFSEDGKALLIERNGIEGYIAYKDIASEFDGTFWVKAQKKTAVYKKQSNGKFKQVGYFFLDNKLKIYGIEGGYLKGALYYLKPADWRLIVE